MLNTLRDLFRHEAWADAQQFRALLAQAPAAADREILDRVNHIHLVQRWFLSLFQGTPLPPEKLEPLASIEDVQASTEQYHAGMRALLESLDAVRLGVSLTLPRTEYHPTVSEAMLQVAMHSQYHRGQNARRLRELGVEPPTTDYLLWVMRGRPEADSHRSRNA